MWQIVLHTSFPVVLIVVPRGRCKHSHHRKLNLEEFESLTQDHLAEKWGGLEPNLDLSWLPFSVLQANCQMESIQKLSDIELEPILKKFAMKL